jgi:translation initiation factor IF-3
MDILLVGEDGRKIGNMSMESAQKLANDEGKDLVIVNAKQNIYRIIDSGKLKYERKQKEKSQREQKRTHKVKEIKLKLSTEQHDLDIKIKRIREFLSKGLKTKVTLQFKGRQRSFQEVGLEKMNTLISAVTEDGLAIVDKSPKFDGNSIIAFLIPSK